MQTPVLETHAGVVVVRDDLLPGGSKARFLVPWMTEQAAREFVYAGPAFGAAQVALAIAAKQCGKKARLYVAGRKVDAAFAADMPFNKPDSRPVPFPANPHYEVKAWRICQAQKSPSGTILFWNVSD